MGVLRIWAHIHPQCAGESEFNVPLQPLRRAAFQDMPLCRAVALRHSLDPLIACLAVSADIPTLSLCLLPWELP